MCSGRVDPQFVLDAFAEGADGVLIGGCHPGDCHYQEGNYKALRRVHLLKRVLRRHGDRGGAVPARVDFGVRGGQGPHGHQRDGREQVRALGPLKRRSARARRVAEEVQ